MSLHHRHSYSLYLTSDSGTKASLSGDSVKTKCGARPAQPLRCGPTEEWRAGPLEADVWLFLFMGLKGNGRLHPECSLANSHMSSLNSL